MEERNTRGRFWRKVLPVTIAAEMPRKECKKVKSCWVCVHGLQPAAVGTENEILFIFITSEIPIHITMSPSAR